MRTRTIDRAVSLVAACLAGITVTTEPNRYRAAPARSYSCSVPLPMYATAIPFLANREMDMQGQPRSCQRPATNRLGPPLVRHGRCSIELAPESAFTRPAILYSPPAYAGA